MRRLREENAAGRRRFGSNGAELGDVLHSGQILGDPEGVAVRGVVESAILPTAIRTRMTSAIASALSGISNAAARADTAARNIAGIGTGRPASGRGGNTIAAADGGSSGAAAPYEPASSRPAVSGLTSLQEADPIESTISLATARQSFAANVKSLQAATSLTDKLLAIST